MGTLARLKTWLARTLPAPVAERLRRLYRPLKEVAAAPHEAASREQALAGALASNEAGIVGLSQELGRLSDQVEALQAEVDRLATELHTSERSVAGGPSAPIAEPADVAAQDLTGSSDLGAAHVDEATEAPEGLAADAG